MSASFQGLALKTAQAERRKFTRLTCGDGYVGIVVLLGTESCTAIVRDISAGGIGILVDAILAPGDWLNVEVGNSRRVGWYRKTVQVSHASPVRGVRWLVGGAFTQPLTIDECRRLLPSRGGS
jgi:hypothetical protein